jgi:hypothetical protein
MRHGGTSRRGWVALVVLVLGYVVVAAVAGAQRSPLVPPFPDGVTVPGWNRTLARWMGLHGLGWVQLVSICIAVMSILVGAFFVVAWEAWHRRMRVAPIAVVTVASLLLLVFSPVLLSRDVYSYAAYGRALSVHHVSPYARPPSAFGSDPFTPVVASEWIDTRSVYGPAFTLVSWGVTRRWADSSSGTILAFKVLAAFSIALATSAGVLAARRTRPERMAFAAAIIGVNPVVLVHTVGGGHNDAIVAGLLAAAVVLAVGRTQPNGHPRPARDERRSVWAALVVTALLTLAVLVKVVAAIPLGLWLWQVARSSRANLRLRVLGPHAIVIIAVGAAFTAPVFAGWRTLTAIANLASRQGWASGARLVARGAEGLGRTLGGSATGTAFGVATYVASLSVFAFLVWRLGSRAAVGTHADLWGSSLLLFALAAPYLLPWYVAWFAPLLALLASERLIAIGVALSGLLALTGIPAEPAANPGVWRAMITGVHYGASPIALALFVMAARTVIAQTGRQSSIARPSPADLDKDRTVPAG